MEVGPKTRTIDSITNTYEMSAVRQAMKVAKEAGIPFTVVMANAAIKHVCDTHPDSPYR